MYLERKNKLFPVHLLHNIIREESHQLTVHMEMQNFTDIQMMER